MHLNETARKRMIDRFGGDRLDAGTMTETPTAAGFKKGGHPTGDRYSSR